MTDRDLLELIATQVGNLTSKMGDLTSQVGGLVKDMEEIKQKLDQKADKTDIVRLENELKPQIQALFDGQSQNTEQLNRIEEQVSSHEEFILKRIK